MMATVACEADPRLRRFTNRYHCPPSAAKYWWNHYQRARDVAAGLIAELLSDHPNAVLMGDFNRLAERPEMQVLYQKTCQPPGCIVPTFPSWRPDRAIDHILVSSGLLTRTVEAVPAAFSDHLALAMQIDVPTDALR